ncbi:hypothetical protein Q73A0000_06665 [Kaistella flava (ex Peng et al. 2021)]|uniref:Uncharacterized protein n=1 Tax=Kaistella flava (ex Peng et al. 2021) TaxID=2038776 RepID=A0A7M2Y743_9FLAO|nr:hypothetical protein [Kaistella flava (ex Peng et al. 2021)]QOW10067.1 hypothetical protein Q73A0000_06665 [Kaistella flava (ex Peng et al. 2021)]
MILNNKNLFFLFCLSFFPLKGQEIKIILKNFNSESIRKGNSILKKNADNLFSFERKKCEKNLSLVIADQEYLIPNMLKEVRFIVVDFIPNAKNGCYIINQTINDVSQSFNIEDVKNCSSVTNIGLYDKYEKDNPPTVKIKINK